MTTPEHLAVRDWGNAAQAAAEAHLEACWDYYYRAEDAGDDPEALAALGDDPAIGPFCGCATCEVREILLAAIPILADGIVAGEVDPHLLTSGA